MPEKAIPTSPKIKELTQRLESDPRSRVFMELAKEYQAAGELSEAVTVCLKGLETHPRYHSARVLLGKLLLLMERFEEAVPELQKVTVEAPENVLARRLLGEALEGAGQRDEALACLHELLRLHPGDPEAQARLDELTRGKDEGGEAAGLPEAPLQGEPGVETLEVTPDPGEAEEPDWEEVPAASEEAEEVPQVADLPETAAPETPEEAKEVPQVADLPETVALETKEEPKEVPQVADLPETVALETPEGPLQDDAPAAEALEVPLPHTVALDPSELEKVEVQEPEAWEGSVTEAEPEPSLETAPEPEPEPPLEAAPEPEPPIETAPEPEPEPPPEPEPEEKDAALPTPTLAELYEEQGMPDKAAEVCEKILEGDPDNSDVRERLLRLRGGAPAGTAPARLKIRALESWLKRLRRVHDAQSRP